MNFSRRQFLKVGSSTAALLATVGCDQLPRELRVLYAQQPPLGPFRPPGAEQIDFYKAPITSKG